ncbi:hypothetical protein OHC33_008511 [Knufia fluminis]|uniref:Heterokaryon incompatibility domain-containing protein n=1 Tax=Knufia fluminis TaxID=191047 RepID=A0AAN8EAZ4_9EURO|nr:hypothetical protein OHC33_008511 [Knufia fluminis]
MANVGVDPSRGVTTKRVKCTFCDKTFSEKECFFHCHTCDRISLCQKCVLQRQSSTRCDLRSVVIDAQDLRPTFIQGTKDLGFREMVTRAREDRSFRFPRTARKFLSQCDTPEGLTKDRLLSEDNYEPYQDDEAATTRKIENDYSLYDKLDREKKEIRLAWLLQGPEEAGVNVVVARFPYPWIQVKWTGLSYCWGCLDETRKIRVSHLANYLHDGNKPSLRHQTFACTANLEIALRSVRWEDRNIFLWVDALCINQADYEERSYQVSIMSDIFAQANSVCVWLGYNLDQTIASGLIRAMSQLAEEGRKRGRYPPGTSEGHIARDLLDCRIMKEGGSLDRLEAIRIISTFFKNPWFRRVWVLQEVWNARSDVEWKFKLFENICQGFNATDARDKLFGILSMGKETLDISNLDPLVAPDYFKPVSQVFVDFTKWCIRQYRSLVPLGYATYTLRNTETNAHASGGPPSWAINHLPSFATFGEKICETQGHNACGESSIDLELLDDWQKRDPRLLALRGYQLGVVERAEWLHFSSRWDKNNELWLRNDEANDGDGMTFPGASKFIWSGLVSPKTGKAPKHCDLMKHTGTTEHEPDLNLRCTCQELLDDMIMALTQGGMKEHADCDDAQNIHRTHWLTPGEIYPDFAAHWVEQAEQYNSMNVTMTHKESPDKPIQQNRLLIDPEMTLFCSHVRNILMPLASQGDAQKFSMMLMKCNRQVLGELQTGRMGLCPVGTRQGDVVVALFGGRAPFVLRSRPDSVADGQVQEWTFIGECYFQEFMDGKHVSELIETGKPHKLFKLC